ncbi:MAG TPA: FAD-dependent oxidoreductase [Clostridia bacterium]|nr:FAD-dependent oxidoreductase [Clostridia bacterium]
MREREVGVLVIGGGPAGLAAGIAAKEAGCARVLVVDREDAPGGILKQCIHNGFGLQAFGEELTGTEYAERYIEKAFAAGVEVACGTMAIDLTGGRVATIVSRARGLETVRAGAVVLAMGCRERPRGALATPGSRCAGVYTAGNAQKLVNMKGLMPGKRVVILGSGDIGLIMARRMTFMGARVLACVELMPYSAGLTRNIVQCLDDFGIPLLLSHTVVDIKGRERLEGVSVAAVDETLSPIPGTERELACDTLLLSVGLLPENELSSTAGVQLSSATGGAEVDENLQTAVPGVFSCGNVLHVHDLVDFVSEEAARAGKAAARYAAGETRPRGTVPVEAGSGVGGIVPQFLGEQIEGDVKLMFRTRGIYKKARVVAERGGREIYSKREMILVPGEMVGVTLKKDALGSGRVPVRVRIEV